MRVLTIIFALMFACGVGAQDASSVEPMLIRRLYRPVESAAEPVMEEVLVTGEQPGPKLWKVTKPMPATITCYGFWARIHPCRKR